MSIVRVGSTQKFSDNWDNIFSGKKAAPAAKKSGGKKASKAAKAAKKGKKK
jgi:hypothetical protein